MLGCSDWDLVMQASYQGHDDIKALENLKLLLSMGIEASLLARAWLTIALHDESFSAKHCIQHMPLRALQKAF